MKLKNLTKEELETMPLDDIAYMILKEKDKKMKTMEIFKIISDLLGYSEKEFDDRIADFFALLATEKRFIQLEKGYWDLTENHTAKIRIEEIEEAAEEDDAMLDKDLIDSDEETNEDSEPDYFDSTIDTEDDQGEDDLKDLVIMDEDAEEHEL